MNNEDWDLVQWSLSLPYWPIKLDCDGYILTIQRVRCTEMRDCIIVSINGVAKLDQRDGDPEERRRFCYEKKKFLYKPKRRAEIKEFRRKQSKRFLKELDEKYRIAFNPDAIYTWHTQIWPNFKKLKSHLIKNNKEITLVKEEAINGEVIQKS